MKKYGMLMACLIATIIVNAQLPKFKWAKSIGGAAGHEGRSIATDSRGNLYALGVFQGTVDFDPGANTFNLTSAGNKDIFISKFDASGNFKWSKRVGGTLIDEAYNIAVDANGNVYGTGTFQGVVDFDSGVGTSNLTSGGSFVLKLDSLGSFGWARQITGEGISITVSNSGTVYATGGSVVSKLNASGNLIWSKSIGGTPAAIALDASENIHTTGQFAGTVDFDPGAGTTNLVSTGATDVFLSKLDSAGKFTWARRVGGTLNEMGRAIAIDAHNNVYVSGYFNGTVDFDPGAGTYNLTTHISGYDFFILKLNAAGFFTWAKKIGAPAADDAFSIAVDKSENVYATGFYADTVDFDPGAGVYILRSTTLNAYIVKLDSSGNFGWARDFGGSGADGGFAIAADGAGNVFTAGMFAGTVDFDPDTSTFNLTSATNSNYFVLKLNTIQPPNSSVKKMAGMELNAISVYPNPARDIFVVNNRSDFKQTIYFYNITGALMISITADANSVKIIDSVTWAKGLYILTGEKLIPVKLMVE